MNKETKRNEEVTYNALIAIDQVNAAEKSLRIWDTLSVYKIRTSALRELSSIYSHRCNQAKKAILKLTAPELGQVVNSCGKQATQTYCPVYL